MKDRFDECSVILNKKIDSRSEKGKTFILKNTSSKIIKHVKVDGCLITDDCKKCDFLYEVLDNNLKKIEKVLYVELKGKDFSHGIEQLESTIKILREWYQEIKNKHAFLVGRGIPSFRTEVQKITLYFKRSYGVSFRAKTNRHVEII